MNPSVAEVAHSDPTLRRTGNFARQWGYGGQLVGNVHAYRATNPKKLLSAEDPVGPENDRALASMASRAEIIVLAYGKPPAKRLRGRGVEVVTNLRAAGAKLCALRISKDGVTPKHPLYLTGDLRPVPYEIT